MNTIMNNSKRVRGFGLIEMMIALALGVVLVGGVIQVFIGIRASFQIQQNLSFLQETGRFAIETIKPNLRDAGKLDFCVADLPVRSHLDPGGAGYDPDLFDPSLTITAWEYQNTSPGDAYGLPSAIVEENDGSRWNSTTATTLPASIAALAIPGSDILLVKSADAVEGLTACNDNVASADDLNINVDPGCAAVPPDPSPLTPQEVEALAPENSIMFVTDCTSGGDLFQRANPGDQPSLSRACGGGGNPGNICGGDWSRPYSDTMQILQVSSAAIFVGVGASGEPALFLLNLGTGGVGSAPVELAEGVENMQIRFGILNALGSINYFEPDNVANPANIMSIAVSMLVRSGDLADSTIEVTNFDLEGVTVISPGTDRRLRKVFSTTVAVRNRISVL